MAYFESDKIDSTSLYSYVPTGGIVTLAAPFSKYSDATYLSIGLIPCDGRVLNASTSPQYANLFSAIGILYGGTGITSFNVPSLATSKVAIAGTSATFHNVNTVGTRVTSIGHDHTITATNNSFTLNNQNVTHDHTVTWNSVGNNATDTSHTHTFESGSVGEIGPNVNKNGSAGVSGGGLNGNHTHNTDITSANSLTGGSTAAHSHTPASALSLGMGANTATLHSHAASLTTATTTSITNYVSTDVGIPYANVLYFIKA
jgi:microcystin-dependent protein